MSPAAQLLDGKQTAKHLMESLAREIAALNVRITPRLVAVLVGDNPASEVYVARKMKVAREIGIESELHRFPATVSQSELVDHLEALNQNPEVHAVLVQLPLPHPLPAQVILDTVLPHKDVDGFHPLNQGKLALGIEPPALPCTPAGILQLLDAYQLSVDGLRAAVVGRSNIVGKPITLMLTHRNATVTLCHSKTRDLESITRECDLIVAATGYAGLIRAEGVKPGAIVVDVGMNRLASGALVGDVDFEGVRNTAAYITPVPGGVGPMTIAMLMRNTLRLYQFQEGLSPKPILFG